MKAAGADSLFSAAAGQKNGLSNRKRN